MALTPQQQRLIQSLLVERTPSAACVAAGCTTRAYSLWMKTSPEFVAELHAARARVFDGIINSAIGAATSAIAVVHQVLDNIMVPNTDKIEWVKLALQLSEQAVLRDTLLARLNKLEEQHKSISNDEPWVTIEGTPSQQLT